MKKEKRFLKLCLYLELSSRKHRRKVNKTKLYLKAYRYFYKKRFNGKDIIETVKQIKKKYYPDFTNCSFLEKYKQNIGGPVLAAAMAVGALTQVRQIVKSLKREGENN